MMLIKLQRECFQETKEEMASVDAVVLNPPWPYVLRFLENDGEETMTGQCFMTTTKNGNGAACFSNRKYSMH